MDSFLSTVVVTCRDSEAEEKFKRSATYYTLTEIYFARVIIQTGFNSIFEAMDDALNNLKCDTDDCIFYMHDDIDFLSKNQMWFRLSELLKKKKDIGFIGVAGTKLLKTSAIWWEGLNQGTYMSPLAGIVYHGESEDNMYPTYFGNNCNEEVVVLDGCLLGATYKTWRTITVAQPLTFKGNWDFYDIYWTFQAHMRGLKNYVVPFSILHKSKGEINGKESWHKNRQAFIVKYGKHLPKGI